MPPARRAAAKPKTDAKTTTGRAAPKRATSASSSGASAPRSASGTRATRSSATAGGAGAQASPAGEPSAKPKRTSSARSPEAALEATAERVRKLNERIIAAGKQTGETTLSSYEKALKAIAGAVERGPGSSDIDWISQLATSQAKFIREFTEAWTSAARNMLK
ncbi:MAG: hypothetical protein ACLP50_30530 [Solirubrobacteraceae bacterium]